jgi:hypothetical protein
VIIAKIGADMSVFGSGWQAGILGGNLFWQQRIRRQTQKQPRPRGQCVLEALLDAGQSAAKAKGTHLKGQISSSQSTAPMQAGDGSRGP